ncbi:MAG: hypothetical protein LBU41_00965 [Clostridiales Family XIII bacterium]|jgi:hypothetical protein|nr:hypothetical protein [Clostridiales Family XIII bacterium]
MKQRKIILLALLVSVLVLFSACSGDANEDDKTKNPAPETTNTAISDKDDSVSSGAAITSDNVNGVFVRIGATATQIQTSFGAISVTVPEGEVRPVFTSENPRIQLAFASLNSVFYETPFASGYLLGDAETCTGLEISCRDLFGLKEEMSVEDFISALKIKEHKNKVDEVGNKTLHFLLKDRLVVIDVPYDSISPGSVAYVTYSEAYNW